MKLLIAFTLLLVFSVMVLPQQRNVVSDLSVQLQREYGPDCSKSRDRESCRQWVEILDDLQADHHDMHPNGQTIGEKAGSTHNSNLTPIERAREMASKLKDRAVRARVKALLKELR